MIAHLHTVFESSFVFAAFHWFSQSDEATDHILRVKFVLCVVVVVAQCAPDMVQRILVGNKSDEEVRRQVTKEQGCKVWLNFILWSHTPRIH